ncbi:hypothetical protein [Mycolicibacterium iranicum]|uniref:hypothetical protein n=1 Tax=Mycolicibacterium iranicum TaxID=912594 RepID=UPI0010425496|nr:hypothetical protein [Mycolicibacterium iranicum]
MPVVRWLQVGAVAAGIGVAIAASPGTAFADDRAASESDSVASASPGPEAPGPSDTGHTDDSEDTGPETDDEDALDTDVADVESDDPDDVVEASEETAAQDDGSGAVIEATAVEESVVEESVVREADVDQAVIREADVDQAVVQEAVVEEADPVEHAAAPFGTSPAGAAAAPLSAPTTAQASLDQLPCGCTLNRALTDAANWLALHPRVPFGPFLEAGVYLVRRTLFPASVGVITKPVTVRLHFTDTTQSSGENKLGIYLAMAGSTTPVLFEFDTGSAGLFAAYSETPGASPWWGDNFEDTGNPTGVTFDSGLVYAGTGATTAVSLYSSQDSCTSILNTSQVLVGQMDEIGTSTDPTQFWGAPGSTPGKPPIQGAFYGDFGMALNDRESGIVNVLSQLKFGWGVRPGWVVHIDPITDEAWLQIGLTRSDLNNDVTMYFSMDPDPAAPPTARVPRSHLRYYALQPFTATLHIDDGETIGLSIDDPDVPILPDTGASTTLHNTQSSPNPVTYMEFTDWTEEFTKGKLDTGLNFFLTATTTSGQKVTFFQFVTSESTDGGRVGVQNKSSTPPPAPAPPDQMYYLNSGRSMFNEYDVIYSLGNPWGGGTIGLLPQGIQSAERSNRYSK